MPQTTHTLTTTASKGATEDGSGRGCLLIPAVANSLQERDSKGADSDTKPGHLIPVAFDMTHGEDPARLTGDKTNTLQSRMGTGGNQVPCVATSMAVRRLTPTECERLQGFPDGWTTGFSDSVRYKMLGNAVTVNVAEWIAKRMAAQWG